MPIMLNEETYTTYVKTPWGNISLKGNRESLLEISFGNGGRQSRSLPRHMKQAAREIGEYFEGRREKFSFPVTMRGSKFQMKVWEELKKIPFGETLTYGEIAQRLRKPQAARAVGGACHRNRFPLVIPCHRVVGSKGLTGFAAGLKWKQGLLDHENSYLSSRNKGARRIVKS